MTLNVNTKNWLAQNAGINGCYTASGLYYQDPDNVTRSGGTGDVLNAFFVAHLINRDTISIIANTSYNNLKSTNGNADISMDDISWVYNNDGVPGNETGYCMTITPTPTSTPTPTLTPTPTVGPTPTPDQFEFIGVPEGTPSIILNLANLAMRQAQDYHFEMNDILITNTSPYPVNIALEVKLFQGGLSYCPSTGYVFDGMDRTTSRSKRIKFMEPGETASLDADFYQPSTIEGLHTVCLLVHGAWYKADLEREILPITG